MPGPPPASNVMKVLDPMDIQLLEFLHQILVGAVCPGGEGKGPLYGVSSSIFILLIVVGYYFLRKMRSLKVLGWK